MVIIETIRFCSLTNVDLPFTLHDLMFIPALNVSYSIFNPKLLHVK